MISQNLLIHDGHMKPATEQTLGNYRTTKISNPKNNVCHSNTKPQYFRPSYVKGKMFLKFLYNK